MIKLTNRKEFVILTPVTFFALIALAALVIGTAVAVFIMEVFIPVCEHVRNMWKMHKAEQSPEHKRYCEVVAKQQQAIAKYHTVNSYLSRMAQAKTREELAEVKAEADAFLNGYYSHATA